MIDEDRNLPAVEIGRRISARNIKAVDCPGDYPAMSIPRGSTSDERRIGLRITVSAFNESNLFIAGALIDTMLG